MGTDTNRITFFIALCLILTVAACGGGDNGLPTRAKVLVFNPEPAVGGSSIYLDLDSSEPSDFLVLELRAQDLTNLAGVFFELEVPTEILRFVGFTDGGFMGSGVEFRLLDGNPLTGFASAPTLQGGRRREVSGSGVIMKLRFETVGSGNGVLRFLSSNAVNANPGFTNHLESLGLPSFGGGQVSVQL